MTAAAAVGALPCHAVVIDDFSEGPLLLRSYDRPTYDTTQTFLNPDRTAGGSRHWTRFYHNIGSTEPTPDSYSQILVDPTDEVFEFRSVDEPGAIRGYFNLTYGSDEEPLGIDLTEDDADRLRLRFQGELSSPWMQVRVVTGRTDGDGSGSFQWPLLAPRQVVGADPIFDLPFPQDRPELDFANVSSITLSVIRYFAGNYFRLDTIETATAPIAGDFDRNGVVDQQDYEHWAANYPLLRPSFPDGELVPTFGGRFLTTDGNNDGDLNAADYSVWRDAYDALSAAPAPEPNGLAVALTAAALGPSLRRRRR